MQVNTNKYRLTKINTNLIISSMNKMADNNNRSQHLFLFHFCFENCTTMHKPPQQEGQSIDQASEVRGERSHGFRGH